MGDRGCWGVVTLRATPGKDFHLGDNKDNQALVCLSPCPKKGEGGDKMQVGRRKIKGCGRCWCHECLP